MKSNNESKKANNENRKAILKELVEKGKIKGMLTYKK